MTEALLTALLVAAAVLVAGSGSRRRVSAVLARERPSVTQAPSPSWSGRRPPTTADVALLVDLVAAALAAGLPPARALEVAAAALGGPTGEAAQRVAALWVLGAAPDGGWDDAPEQLEPLRRALYLVAVAGVPGVPLLRSTAEELRRRDRRSAQARAESLGVRMVLPLGLCALPAFVAWAVVPVVLSLAGQVLR